MTNFLFDTTTLPLRSNFLIAGVSCTLSTNSPEVFSRLNSWSQCDFLGEPSLQIDIFEHSSAEYDETDVIHFRGLSHLVFAVLGSQNQFVLDLLRRRAAGIVSPKIARDQDFWNYKLLPILLGTFGTTMGLVPLHCACLDYDGRGLLIAGPAGAGKSTLAAALAQCGLSFVSDDWSYVSAAGQDLTIHGLGIPAKLLPDTTRFFPTLRQQRLGRALNGELSFEVDVANVFGAQVKPYSRPHWILFLDRDTVPGCRILPCDKEFVRAFFEEFAERLPDELPEARALRSETILRLTETNSWLLKTGDSPQETARAIATFCAGRSL
jgi:hypothetical protein